MRPPPPADYSASCPLPAPMHFLALFAFLSLTAASGLEEAINFEDSRLLFRHLGFLV